MEHIKQRVAKTSAVSLQFYQLRGDLLNATLEVFGSCEFFHILHSCNAKQKPPSFTFLPQITINYLKGMYCLHLQIIQHPLDNLIPECTLQDHFNGQRKTGGDLLDQTQSGKTFTTNCSFLDPKAESIMCLQIATGSKPLLSAFKRNSESKARSVQLNIRKTAPWTRRLPRCQQFLPSLSFTPT